MVTTQAPLVSVVMPCLNEEATIGSCIEKIQRVFATENIQGEIIVCDNGSTDRSVQIAETLGVKVVHQPAAGYGNAYICGIGFSTGKFIVMGDADDTYDFNLIPVLLQKLEFEGKEFVTGSRFLADGGANIKFLHRYVGNPVLTWLLNFFFGTKYSDVCCGLRAFSRSTYNRIAPVSTGMEFNLELAINAGLAQMSVCEIPTRLGPRQGVSKLNTFVDGWRSLLLMLFYCPDKLFLYPAVLILASGLVLHALLFLNFNDSITADQNVLKTLGFAAPVLTVVACQAIALGMLARSHSWSRRFLNQKGIGGWLAATFSFKTGVTLGASLTAAGVSLVLSNMSHLLPQLPPQLPQLAICSLSASLILAGLDIVMSSTIGAVLSRSRPKDANDLAKSPQNH